MILTRKYLRQIVHMGNGKEETVLSADRNGVRYVVVTRFDVQRTDHYVAEAGDVCRV